MLGHVPHLKNALGLLAGAFGAERGRGRFRQQNLLGKDEHVFPAALADVQAIRPRRHLAEHSPQIKILGGSVFVDRRGSDEEIHLRHWHEPTKTSKT